MKTALVTNGALRLSETFMFASSCLRKGSLHLSAGTAMADPNKVRGGREAHLDGSTMASNRLVANRQLVFLIVFCRADLRDCHAGRVGAFSENLLKIASATT
eukprot:758484-Hanusia_phi.AAC.5